MCMMGFLGRRGVTIHPQGYLWRTSRKSRHMYRFAVPRSFCNRGALGAWLRSLPPGDYLLIRYAGVFG